MGKAAASRTPDRETLVGTVLGSYRVMGRIAEGGMGIIYRAEHLRLPRKVALKVLKPELARYPSLVDRFLDEARAVNQIRHPNLVDVIDVAEGPGDPPLVYLVMELLEGMDLARHLRDRGALDPLQAVQIADAVAQALIAVHEQRIVHRDLKAENIFLVRRPDGSSGVKLLDFGIATTFGGRSARKLTSPGARVGTPDCMAPEQVSGESLDERTDIYAFGLVLYHMLNGAPAFHSSSINEVLSSQLYSKPPPLNRRSSASAVIPEALEQVVMRCLEKSPADRYPDMVTVRRAIWEGIGVQDARIYLSPAATAAPTLGEAPTLPPGAARAALPRRARGASRGRWLATGLLAGLALPMIGLVLRVPLLAPPVSVVDSCPAPTAAPPPAGITEGESAMATASPDPVPVPAPLLESAADGDDPVRTPELRTVTTPPGGSPAGSAVELPDRLRGQRRPPAPAAPAEKNDTPASSRDPLDRTVNPFVLQPPLKSTASPVALRDGV